ncbi:S8 family peptidase [Amycolatopsis pithecellobii]|uniref:S8 family serine peptidase n=1 Tax=Amycolatopsis pithecellobii TaxID=664692 RepID=A0A6N7YTV5_9PSEU|nr:S8 family peptidase [Amycolatopsis pithecellobii]MTD55362.1 S8 family serine peptidase [Amycolatopsis pithecellobii]
MKLSAISLLLTVAALATAPAAVADPAVQENPPSWGLDRIDQHDGALDQRYHYDTTADEVTVYVIDTGVDAALPEFEGRVQPGRNFVNGTTETTDGNGDGTRLASIVGGKDFGVAKKVRIVPVKVLDDSGNGTLPGIISGIQWVAQNATQPAVAVLGIGGPGNVPLDNAVKALTAVMPVAVPAGWSATDVSTSSPGRVPEVLTVGATDDHDAIAAKSNFGAGVDLFAPGTAIPTAAPGDPASGTSMAAAFVAGAAALYRAGHPAATAAEVSRALVDAATPGVLTGLPAGTPNRLLCTVPVTVPVPAPAP